MYNEMLVPLVPEESTIVGFADDLAVFVTEKHPEEVQVYTTENMGAMSPQLARAGLTLADEKAECKLSETEASEFRLPTDGSEGEELNQMSQY